MAGVIYEDACAKVLNGSVGITREMYTSDLLLFTDILPAVGVSPPAAYDARGLVNHSRCLEAPPSTYQPDLRFRCIYKCLGCLPLSHCAPN